MLSRYRILTCQEREALKNFLEETIIRLHSRFNISRILGLIEERVEGLRLVIDEILSRWRRRV